MAELDELHSAFGETSRYEAIGCEGSWRAGIFAIEVKAGFRFTRDIRDFRSENCAGPKTPTRARIHAQDGRRLS